jgi:hypothetical protein
MKKTIYLMTFILLLSTLAIGCSTGESKLQIQYGTYTIDRVEHLPLFSSATPDYFLDKNIGTLFTVGKDSFSTDSSAASAPSAKKVIFDNVTYVQEYLEDTPGYKVMSNSEDTGFRLYYMDEEIWIGHFSWYGEKKDAWWADYIFGVALVE